MSEFFKNIVGKPCSIHSDKMHEIFSMVAGRDVSTGTSLLELITIFADRVDEFEEALVNYENASECLKESYAEIYYYRELKISMCIALLAKYFYPIIEQLERLVDDGIVAQDEPKKRGFYGPTI